MFDIIIPSSFSLGIKDEEDWRLGGAIEAVFPSLDDNIIMVWNDMPIWLSCKYDISIIVNDIAYIVSELLKKENFSFKNTWPSSNFYATWKITSFESEVSVVADWYIVTGDEKALNKENKIVTAKIDFITKLCSVLNFVSQAIKKVGYTTEDLEDYDNLLQVLQRAGQLNK